jgi:uncharacterized small protein (DUF1192 family)
MNIDAQIVDREARRAKIQTDLLQIRNSIPKLERDLAGIICSGNTQQKANCEGRKKEIRELIQQRLQQIKLLENNIALLNKEIADLSAQREAEGKAMITLAQQGLTPAAVLANTTAQAEAATQIANAQAKAMATSASTKAMIYWFIAIIIAIVVLIIIRKKLTNV